MLQVSIEAPQPDRTALFLDVDGTLLDLAASPTAVVVPPGSLNASPTSSGRLVARSL